MQPARARARACTGLGTGVRVAVEEELGRSGTTPEALVRLPRRARRRAASFRPWRRLLGGTFFGRLRRASRVPSRHADDRPGPGGDGDPRGRGWIAEVVGSGSRCGGSRRRPAEALRQPRQPRGALASPPARGGSRRRDERDLATRPIATGPPSSPPRRSCCGVPATIPSSARGSWPRCPRRRHSEAALVLTSALRHPDPRVRFEAAHALGMPGDAPPRSRRFWPWRPATSPRAPPRSGPLAASRDARGFWRQLPSGGSAAAGPRPGLLPRRELVARRGRRRRGGGLVPGPARARRGLDLHPHLGSAAAGRALARLGQAASASRDSPPLPRSWRAPTRTASRSWSSRTWRCAGTSPRPRR